MEVAKMEVRFRVDEVWFGMLSFMVWDGAERAVVSGLTNQQPCISLEESWLTLTSSQSADPICKKGGKL